MIYEVVLETGPMCVRVLFNGIPTLDNLLTALQLIFNNHDEKIINHLERLLSGVTEEEGHFQVGEEVEIKIGEEKVGSLVLQTRTLFEV